MSAAATSWSPEDTEKALAIWAEYQTSHDLRGREGQTAGIEPDSGTVWFGASAKDIAQRMEKTGGLRPFYAVRVGSDHYLRKGGRR